MNVVVVFFNSILKTTKIGFLIGITIAIFLAVTFANMGFGNIKRNFNADISLIEEQHNIKMKIVSQDTDEKGNGSYEIVPKKKQDMKFKAVKNGGMATDDFEANFQRYIFNSWNSETKKQFEITEETNEKGLLVYENYINATSLEEVKERTNYLIEFLEYAEEWNKEYKVTKYSGQKKRKLRCTNKKYIHKDRRKKNIPIQHPLPNSRRNKRRSNKTI